MDKSLKYNFGYGFMPEEVFDIAETEKAFNYTFNRNEDNMKFRMFSYGHMQGDQLVRKELANWYGKQINCYVNPNNLMITSGVSIGLEIACVTLLNRNDNILVEVPSFFSGLNLISQTGLNLYPIERKRDIDNQFDLNELEESIVKNNIKAFYLVANYSNPLGINLRLKERMKIYELSKKYGVYIFSDDIYEFLYLDEKTRELPIFYSDENALNQNKEEKNKYYSEYDNNSNEFVVSISSFNKLIGPGMKVGFIQAHKNVINKMTNGGLIFSGGNCCSITHHVLRTYIELGLLDKMMNFQREILIEKKNALYSSLLGCKLLSFNEPEGGYFLFIKLDDRVNIEKLLSKREERQMNFIQGESFVALGFRNNEKYKIFKQCIRLSFSLLTPDEIKKGANEFIKLVEDCVEQG